MNIYIVIHRLTVSLYHYTLVWLGTWDALGCDRNPPNFTSGWWQAWLRGMSSAWCKVSGVWIPAWSVSCALPHWRVVIQWKSYIYIYIYIRDITKEIWKCIKFWYICIYIYPTHLHLQHLNLRCGIYHINDRNHYIMCASIYIYIYIMHIFL